MSQRQILVTSALPYVNGDIHLGHLVEFIQTDIWVRYQRLRGHEVRYFCADDTHGAATMIRARNEGREPDAILAEMSELHQRDLAGFGVHFDHFGSTHAASNERLVGEFWAALRSGGHVAERDVTQLFDPEAGVFLADRFVKGRCPRCDSADQYGDSCDNCGATYTPDELIEPRSTLSNSAPVSRTARHYFVELSHFQETLTHFTQDEDRLQPEIANWIKGEFLREDLHDWDVSRPAPYFGFEIPDAPGHYFYVWVDAPIGYMSATHDWCEQAGEDFDRWWRNPDCEIHHFIGKDITYFHALFWPAMLTAAGYEKPRKIHVHGMLTVDGAKMSKSKGTFIRASTYLEHLPAESLRYFYASMLSSAVRDIDLNIEEFCSRFNAHIVGKVVNLASRTARFVKGNALCDPYPEDGGLFARGVAAGEEIAAAYEATDYSQAVRRIIELADDANEFVEARAPWTLAKDPEKAAELVETCTIALNLFRQITVYLQPIVPELVERASALFGGRSVTWEDASTPLGAIEIGAFKHLSKRIEAAQAQAMIETGVESAAASSADAPAETQPFDAEPIEPECTIDDFAKIDLRVARVVEATSVPDARKLVQLTLNLGGDEVRTVFAGIKKHYEPEALVGRLVVVVANLAPRKMKFGVSEGMVIAAGGDESGLFLLGPDSGAAPGMRVR